MRYKKRHLVARHEERRHAACHRLAARDDQPFRRVAQLAHDADAVVLVHAERPVKVAAHEQPRVPLRLRADAVTRRHPIQSLGRQTRQAGGARDTQRPGD